jgi:hypothetical protein
VQRTGGAPAAPGWGGVARWWRAASARDDADLLRDYAFLSDVIPAGLLAWADPHSDNDEPDTHEPHADEPDIHEPDTDRRANDARDDTEEALPGGLSLRHHHTEG